MGKKQTHRQRAIANASKKQDSRNATKGGQSRADLDNFAQGEISEQNATSKSESMKVNTVINPVSCPPKGLINLGNTCFFNSVMQNLCRTPGLLRTLQKSGKETKFSVGGDNLPTLDCELPSVFKLTQSLLDFLTTMGEDYGYPVNNQGRSKRRTSAESPRALFDNICSVCPRFRGYQQQDSQELLQALLDSLKIEEIKRRKQAILSELGLLNKKVGDIDPNLKERVKIYGQNASKKPTVVDMIFGGQLISSVLCDECGQVTQVTEDFLDIPLPIAESIPSPPLNGNKKDNKKYPVVEEENAQESQASEGKDSHPTPPPSKHLKKKQRQQARRKNNGRRRTKSQNSEKDVSDCNIISVENNEKQEDVVEDEDSVSNVEKNKDNVDANSASGHDEIDENELKRDFDEHIKNKMQDIGNDVRTEKNPASGHDEIDENELKRDFDEHIKNKMQDIGNDVRTEKNPASGHEEIDENELKKDFDEHIKNKLQDIGDEVRTEHAETGIPGGQNGIVKTDEEHYKNNAEMRSTNRSVADLNAVQIIDVDGLALQLATLEVKENHVGTDFSTNKARYQGSTIKTEGDQRSVIDRHNLVNIEKGASKIVDTAMTDAIEQYGRTNGLLDRIGNVTEFNNNYLRGGKMAPGVADPESNAPQSEQSRGEEKEEERAACTSTPSDNYAKEVSECGISRPAESQNGMSLFDTPAKKPGVKFTSFCSKLPTSVSPRYEPKKLECSIESCLHKFTMAEMLTGNNKFGCEECTKRQGKGVEKPKTVYCDASKQLLIKTPPIVLTLQLKRFQQSGRSLRKFSKKVEVPAEFDLSPFCTQDDDETHANKDGRILYRIYGVVEHSGSLSRGHYVAYVNTRRESSAILKYLDNEVESPEATDSNHEGQWYNISDNSVSKCTLERALSCNAYLLFYERIL